MGARPHSSTQQREPPSSRTPNLPEPRPPTMTKIHPNSPCIEHPPPPPPDVGGIGEEASLTVWRKSLLFNCKGFTVYDSSGNLTFRVDNYSTRSKREIVLMDAGGVPLFTIRRKRLSVGENWLIYEGEQSASPKFSVAKHVTIRQSKTLAHVTARGAHGAHSYAVEGSYSQRCCAVLDGRRRAVAELRRKETASGVALGGDVFRLVVKSGFDASWAMAIVILLDQMFGS